MAEHTEHADSHSDDDHHDGGHLKMFVSVAIALLILTGISFAAGSSEMIMSTPSVGWTIMMAVSCAKALLVMLFFMHLLWEANWKYVLTIPASIMSVFLLLMLFPDIKMRTKHYAEERWLYAATPATASDHAEHNDEAHQD